MQHGGVAATIGLLKPGMTEGQDDGDGWASSRVRASAQTLWAWTWLV